MRKLVYRLTLIMIGLLISLRERFLVTRRPSDHGSLHHSHEPSSDQHKRSGKRIDSRPSAVLPDKEVSRLTCLTEDIIWVCIYLFVWIIVLYVLSNLELNRSESYIPIL